MLNIVIPMAGRGHRFAQEGFKDPKPLIDIKGKRMIEVVINNLKVTCDHRFIFVCQGAHVRAYDFYSIFEKVTDKFEVVEIDGITDGAAVTVLKAREYIDSSVPLMIANSDQWIDADIDHYLSDIEKRKLDGSMMTMKATDPKWSYAKLAENGFVTEVVEKQVVSDEATTGIYNFARGSDFCKAADYMIEENIRSHGEFYVAPVYTYLAEKGAKIGIYNIGGESNGMYGFGIPSDLRKFLTSDICDRAVDF